MKHLFAVPENKKVRVIIDSDANCECDDHYAIVHALYSPKVDVCGIVATHYGTQELNSMELSYNEIEKVCRLSGKTEQKIFRGCKSPLNSLFEAGLSDGVDFIIEEALRDDNRPLFVICQGAMTNVASALLKEPQISGKIVIVAVGGTNYPHGGFEFNTLNDTFAFNVVMNSEAPVWMIPENVYSTVLVGFYELVDKVYPCGAIGKYLVTNTFRVNAEKAVQVPRFPMVSDHEYACGFPSGESWSLGDSTALGLILNASCGRYDYVKAPNVCANGSYEFSENSKEIRWYNSINSGFILADFFAKIKLASDAMTLI